VMEGFGMSAQEAAATGLPVVASDRVPFVTEYLLEETVKTLVVGSDGGLVRQGAGGIVVPADHISGFAYALEMLLSNDALREKMGANAYRVTVPYFSWQSRVPTFLNKLAISSGDVDGNP